MPYQQVNTAELLALMPQLQSYAEWDAMQQFVAEVFGPGVVRVTLATSGRYNDEYTVADAHVTAYDAAGREVPPDLSLPFFAPFKITDAERQACTSDTYIEEEVADWNVWRAYAKRLAQVRELPEAVLSEDWGATTEFDLLVPPSLPTLFTSETRE